MIKRNIDIRKSIQESGLKLWEVAYQYGVSDSTFSVKLRKELPETEKQKIFKIIEDLREREVVKQ